MPSNYFGAGELLEAVNVCKLRPRAVNEYTTAAFNPISESLFCFKKYNMEQAAHSLQLLRDWAPWTQKFPCAENPEMSRVSS